MEITDPNVKYPPAFTTTKWKIQFIIAMIFNIIFLLGGIVMIPLGIVYNQVPIWTLGIVFTVIELSLFTFLIVKWIKFCLKN